MDPIERKRLRVEKLINDLRSLFTEKELGVLDLPEESKYGIKPNYTYGMFFNKAKQDYFVAKLDVDVYGFIMYLLHEKVSEHILENSGKMKITIKNNKPRPDKPPGMHGSLDSNEWKKNQKELTSKEHSPDRAVTSNASEDDLPF